MVGLCNNDVSSASRHVASTSNAKMGLRRQDMSETLISFLSGNKNLHETIALHVNGV
jgi:hypothetical protein